MVYFCAMSKRFNIVILITFLSAGVLTCHAQQQPQTGASKSIYLTPMCVYNGDTIPYVKLPTVYIFKPLKFKNRRETVILPVILLFYESNDICRRTGNPSSSADPELKIVDFKRFTLRAE